MLRPHVSRAILATAAASGIALVTVGGPSATAADAQPNMVTKAAQDAKAAASSKDVKVQLLSITDFHSGNPMDWQVGGLATKLSDGRVLPWAGTEHLSTEIKALRGAVKNTITWSNGDNFTAYNWYDKGTADEFGLEKYNKLGMEFSVAGNHDLDWRIDHVQSHLERKKPCKNEGFTDCLIDSTGKVFSGVRGPAISSSLVWTKNGKPVWQTYQVREFKQNGKKYKVAIIGATVNQPEKWPMSFNERVSTVDRVTAINAVSDQLAKQGITAQVLSLHDGGKDSDAYADTCVNLTGPAIDIAKKVRPRISAVITGDTHKVFNCTLPDPDGNDRPIVQAGAMGSQLNQILLTLDAKTGQVKRDKTISNLIPITEDIPADPEIEKITSYWMKKADERAAMVIGYATGDITMTRSEAGEHAVGDLTADAYLWSSTLKENPKADLAIVSTMNGDASEGWDALTHGPITAAEQPDGTKAITYRNAFEATGHDHKVLTVDYTGEQIVQILQDQWATGSIKPVAVSHNVRYSYTADNKVLADTITINGAKLDPAKTYRVAIPAGDYADGGRNDNAGFLAGVNPRTHLRLDNQTVVEYIRAQKTITPPTTDRVTKVG